jgi:Xaa-Pro aminopeptidase
MAVNLRLSINSSAGNNGCVLHYIENSRTKVANDMVLMDLGAEYRYYC